MNTDISEWLRERNLAVAKASEIWPEILNAALRHAKDPQMLLSECLDQAEKAHVISEIEYLGLLGAHRIVLDETVAKARIRLLAHTTTQWAMRNAPNIYNYSSRRACCRAAVDAMIITHTEYEQLREYYGRLWDYVGD